VLIGRRDEDTNCPGTENIKEQDPPEHSADGLWNVLARILGFSSCNGDELDTSVRESGIYENVKKTQKSASISSRVIFFHRAWVFPESKPKTVVFWIAAKINNECHDEKTNDCNDLDTGKYEFCFSVDGNCKDVEAEDDDDDDGEPRGDWNAFTNWVSLCKKADKNFEKDTLPTWNKQRFERMKTLLGQLQTWKPSNSLQNGLIQQPDVRDFRTGEDIGKIDLRKLNIR
jgi:hypothetical protein